MIVRLKKISQGFTLIEILVVVLIVAIMSGVVVMRLPQFVQKSDIELESRRLITLLEMAREESMIQAMEFGFKPTEHGYTFFYFEEESQRWLENDSGSFRARFLADDIKLELLVEGDQLVFGGEGNSKVPPLLLLSSGEMTPFTLKIIQGDHFSQSMHSDGYDDIAWLEDE